MFWRKLSHADYKVLLSVPRALSYSDVAKVAGISSSYASFKIRKLAENAWLRFWVEYRAIGLSPTYVLCKYSPSFLTIASRVELPYVKVVRKIWSSEGAKLLIEATPPAGFERRFAYILPVAVENVWVGEWESRYVPCDSRLVAHTGSSLEVRWDELPEAVRDTLPEPDTSSRVYQSIDRLDLLILREKEEYCFNNLSRIGEKIKVAQQLVSYHFRNHLKPIWKSNYVEPRKPEFPVIYKVEMENTRAALSLLSTLSRIPLLINAFAIQGSEHTIVMLLDVPPGDLAKMHSRLFSVEGVRKAEFLAFVDSSDPIYYGLTAHLGLQDEVWTLEPLEEAIDAALKKE